MILFVAVDNPSPARTRLSGSEISDGPIRSDVEPRKLVLREFDPDPVPVSLVYTAQRLLPLKSRLFLDMATPRLRNVLEKLTKKNPAALAKPDSAAGAYA